jgi:hypothetical protein
MEQTMIKAGRYDLDEVSLGRIYQHVVSNPKMNSWAVITASRGELSKAENKKRNKELEADLRKMGLGFAHADGMWRECKDQTIEYKNCPEELRVPTEEKVLFIPNISKEDAKALGKKWNQDSVLFADGEARKNGEATFIDSKSGEEFNIGKFSAGKIAQGYTKLKGNKVFTFEPKKAEEPKKVDTTKKNNISLKSLVPKGILDKTVKNPKTGRDIKVKTALSYGKASPAYGAAANMVKQAKKNN